MVGDDCWSDDEQIIDTSVYPKQRKRSMECRQFENQKRAWDDF